MFRRTRKEESLETPFQDELRVVPIDDERSREATEALGLIEEYFRRSDRHEISELRSEIEEKRLRLLEPFDFHQLALLDGTGKVIGTAAGVYLAGINAGFVTYLVIDRDNRNRQLGRRLRSALVESFRINAHAAGWDNLRWVLGEVRIESPWLMTLVRTGSVIPFDLEYFHPGLVPGESKTRYVLYREIITDDRKSIPADETRRILYTIYRRAYRVRYPLERDNFRAMLAQLDDHEDVGPNPEVLELAGVTR